MPYEFYVYMWSMACGSAVKNKLFKNMIDFWCCQHPDWFSVNIVEYVMLLHLTSLFKAEILLIYSRRHDQDKWTGYSQLLQWTPV